MLCESLRKLHYDLNFMLVLCVSVSSGNYFCDDTSASPGVWRKVGDCQVTEEC